MYTSILQAYLSSWTFSCLRLYYEPCDKVAKVTSKNFRDHEVHLEDKIQTYNKINGVIRRHFVKQMTKETKLKSHNITAKAALKFGSEAWVLKKRD
jgi:hypothetical protein